MCSYTAEWLCTYTRSIGVTLLSVGVALLLGGVALLKQIERSN